MAWWNAFFGSKEEESSKNTEVTAFHDTSQEEFAGLNFKTALEAHIKWKTRLKGVIDGTGTEVLDPRTVARDDQCVLGKWIIGEGKNQFGKHPSFNSMVLAHTHFHKCAGHALDLALDGKMREAEEELHTGSFAHASQEVCRLLMRLWRDLGIEKK
jgi:hypothetical protein